eukprot:scaffold130601_cov112-Phaeocystis_antarctica.AAC.1
MASSSRRPARPGTPTTARPSSRRSRPPSAPRMAAPPSQCTALTSSAARRTAAASVASFAAP